MRHLSRGKLYAAIGVLLIALVTVSAQALAVARSKPVTSLRYE